MSVWVNRWHLLAIKWPYSGDEFKGPNARVKRRRREFSGGSTLYISSFGTSLVLLMRGGFDELRLREQTPKPSYNWGWESLAFSKPRSREQISAIGSLIPSLKELKKPKAKHKHSAGGAERGAC